MKLQKKPIHQEPRTEKIMIPGGLATTLDEYANYYEFTYNQKISIHDLILEMIGVFMKSDRDFKQWSKNKKTGNQENEKQFQNPTIQTK